MILAIATAACASTGRSSESGARPAAAAGAPPGAAPLALNDVFARLAVREALPQPCFAATQDRSLIACIGTMEAQGAGVVFFHVLGPTPGGGAAWLVFLQNDAAHPASVDREHLDDAARYLAAHAMQPAAFDAIPLERRDGATAKVGAWTIRRSMVSTEELPHEHLEVMCGTSTRPARTDVLDFVFEAEDGPVDLTVSALTRDDVLVIATEHAAHATHVNPVRFDAAKICK
ncbi:MAG: hypothetical protein E6J90_01715 [Deltaproteobacteria bacterium]|nr:MAG: hypothetical protein E6J90_01715 [Deltaproteobacteria bacterium]